MNRINLTKKYPWRGLRNLQNTLDRFFNERWWPTQTEEWGEEFSLPSELSEDKNHFYLKIHLPGVKKENTKIEITSRVLRVSGERKEEKLVEDTEKHYSEVFYGSFSRDFNLPENADNTNIKASFDNGILTITIPKSLESRTQEVRVE